MPDDRIKRPAYQWYVMDARGDEVFMLMSYEQQGIYRALLDQQWIEGSIPADVKHLAVLLRLSPWKFAKCWPLISAKFQPGAEGRLINARLESQRKKLDEFLEEQRKKGQLGGRRKADRLAVASLGLDPVLQPEPSSSSSTSSSSTKEHKSKSVSSATSAEPKDASPTVMTFPTVGPVTTWALTEAQVAKWQGTYPALDVLGVCRRIGSWCDANPHKRKTAKGMKAFIDRWLGNDVDRGRTGGPTAKPSRHDKWTSDGKGEIADV